MQIVPHADEAEPLVDKFCDAGRAEKKDAENDVVLLRRGNEFVRRLAELR